MRLRLLVVSVALISLTGCASSPAIRVSDAEGVESVSAVGMSCKKPFALTQDCSGFSGPTKKIEIGGIRLKVASNAEETVTVAFGPNSSKSTNVVNTGYELLKRELVEKGYQIIKVTPIESVGTMFGYAIETTKPHYTLWDQFTVK